MSSEGNNLMPQPTYSIIDFLIKPGKNLLLRFYRSDRQDRTDQ